MRRPNRKTEVITLRLSAAEKDQLVLASQRAARNPSDAARLAIVRWANNVINPGLATGQHLQEMRHA